MGIYKGFRKSALKGGYLHANIPITFIYPPFKALWKLSLALILVYILVTLYVFPVGRRTILCLGGYLVET